MDALSIFRELLAADLPRWRAAVPELRRRLREDRCLFGTREIVKVLRPKFLTAGEYALLEYSCGVLLGLARRLVHLTLNSPELRSFLGVSPAEYELMRAAPRCLDPVPFARVDSFATAGGPRFVELNAECPAGPGYADMAVEGLLHHPLVAAFRDRTGAFAIPTREAVLQGLLKAWKIAGGQRSPVILITDYLDLPTLPEFHILREHFEARGFRTILEDPRELQYQGGRLVAQGTAVDLVYRRLLVNELMDREREVRPLVQAAAEGAVVLVNPFRCKAVHKKAFFAVLSGDHLDPASWMTEEERHLVEAVVPWTRRVREGHTIYRGRRVDLLPFVATHRQEFVLKPSDEYGGKGVTVGWECPAEAFEKSLRAAQEGDFIVQERIRPLEEPFPMLELDLEERSMIVDLDPYVYFGQVRGVLARLAAGALCNVTSGGGQTPVMLVED